MVHVVRHFCENGHESGMDWCTGCTIFLGMGVETERIGAPGTPFF
jgi:hypothetical protein